MLLSSFIGLSFLFFLTNLIRKKKETKREPNYTDLCRIGDKFWGNFDFKIDLKIIPIFLLTPAEKMECRNCEAPCGKNYVESTFNEIFCCKECFHYFRKQQALLKVQTEIKKIQQRIIDLNFNYEKSILDTNCKKMYNICIFMLNCVLKNDIKSFDGFGLKFEECAGELMEECYKWSSSGDYVQFTGDIKRQKDSMDSYRRIFSLL